MAQGDACDPTDAAQWCAAAGILVVGACLPSLSGEGDTCQAACEPGSDGACGWLDTRTSFVCLDTGGGEGTCVETIALGEPCSPEPGSLPCHSPRATLPGICEDPAGDGAFSCVVACDHEGGREDLQCPYGTACGVPEGEGEGRCLPAVPDNAECSPDAQGSACEWYRDEEDQLWYPGTCRPGFAGAKAYCSRPCGDGKRCNNVEGFVMRNMSCGSAGWCVPEATSGQTCDPAGAKVVCVDAKEQPTPLCVASAGASGGHCRPPCVVTGRYCSTDTGDPGGEMEGTQGLCFDSDGALHGYCLPQRRDGQACDPEGLSDVCSGLCEPEDGGSGICAELGSCSLPADLVSLGTLPGGGELAVSGLLSGERNALQPASCSSSQGPEQVWRLDVAERSRVRIEVHALSGSNEDDLQVYVRSDCADPSSEIACTDTSGSTEELDLGIVEAGSAFDVIVDSYRSSWSLGYWLVVRMLGVRAAGEACDPAGVADTCDDGLACHSTSDACVAAGCGDGVLEDGEECDDAGVAPGDGCSASCTYETVTEVEPNDGDGEDTAAGAALRLLGDMASHVDIDRFELVFPEGARYRMRATLQPREGDCASTGLRHVNFKLVDASGALLAKQERSCGDDEPFEVGAPDGLPAGIYSLQLGETGYAVQEHAPYAVDLHIEAGPIAADSEPCGPLFSDGVCGDTSFCRAHDPEAEGSCAPILCGDGIVVTPEEECEDGNAQPGDGCLDCHLEIFHEIEPNNALDVANELGPYRRVTGTIPVERDKDVFELELTEHAAVFVVGSDGKGGCPPVTLRLALLRAGDQTELAYSSWWGCDEDEPTELSPQSDRDLRSVEPGSYFLSVEASDSSETSAAQYFLDIDVAPLPAEGQPCAVYQDGKIFCAPALVCVPKTSLCETPECGDGVLSEDAGEECDDGGTEPGDGCDTSCLKDFLLETEPNDVPAEAQEGLAPPFLLRGSLSSELDADLYEVRVEHPFRAVAALHDIEGECSEDSRRLDLDLLDETGHRVLASAGCWDFLGSSAGSLGSLVAPGGYLLRVRWDSSFGDVLDQPLEYELRWAPELWSAPIPRPE